VGSSLHRAVTVRGVLYGLWVCLRFVILQKEGFLPIIRGPLWPSPTVAPELLRWHPLGARRG
jgi:hypothetical protein